MNSQKSLPEVISESDLHKAVAILTSGGVIAYPTETVYGLGAAMSRKDAHTRIFAIKRRATARALSFMVDSFQRACSLSGDLSGNAVSLMQTFWPGPLTVVVSAAAGVPSHAVSDEGSIGLRCPDHPVCHQLVAQLDEAISTTSANLTGQPPALSAQAVCDNMAEHIDLVIDGGEGGLGVSSTVVDMTSGQPVLLREGAIPFTEILKNMG